MPFTMPKPQPTDSHPVLEPDMPGLLRRFLSLSVMERQTAGTIGTALQEAMQAGRMAQQTAGHIHHLVGLTSQHSRHAYSLLQGFDAVELDGETVRMRDLTDMADKLVETSVGQIIRTAREAMHAVFDAHKAASDLKNTHAASRQLHALGRQLRAVSINTRIAAGQGADGPIGSIDVLASEMQELLQRFTGLATIIEKGIGQAQDHLRVQADRIALLAAIDIDSYAATRTRIGRINALMQSHAGQQCLELDRLQHGARAHAATVERLGATLSFVDYRETLSQIEVTLSTLQATADIHTLLQDDCVRVLQIDDLAVLQDAGLAAENVEQRVAAC